MENTLVKRFDLSKIAVIASLLVVLSINFHFSHWEQTEKVIGHDPLSYYAYLPATFIYHDLSLEFLKEGKDRLGKQFWGKKTPTGKLAIITSYGMSLLYSPFFLLAHFSADSLGYPADGYSLPYCFALVMSSVFYLFIGLIFLRKILIKYFTIPVVAITLLIITLTTNLLWYVSFEATMSHVYSFGLISIFMYSIDKWVEKPKYGLTIIIGLLVGIIALVRPSNIVIILLFIFWKITSWKDLINRLLLFIKNWQHIIIMIVFFFIVWVPQFIYWKFISGSYIFYSYPDSMGFFFNNPQLYNTLFSWRKGFLIYTPVMIFSFIGIGLLLKNNKQFFLPVLIYWLITWYIISSWWDWWYGGGLSIRPFIDSYGILAFGLAAFLTWLSKLKLIPKYIFISIFVVITIISTWHFKRYQRGSIHWAGMTKKAYFNSFWRATPAPNFYEKVRMPDYKLARKGIYKYEDERKEETK
jgi:hypothetical protein